MSSASRKISSRPPTHNPEWWRRAWLVLGQTALRLKLRPLTPPRGPGVVTVSFTDVLIILVFFFSVFFFLVLFFFVWIGRERELESAAPPPQCPLVAEVCSGAAEPQDVGLSQDLTTYDLYSLRVCIYNYICVFIFNILAWMALQRSTVHAPRGGNTLLSAVVLLYTGEKKQEMYYSFFSLTWNLISNKHFKKIRNKYWHTVTELLCGRSPFPWGNKPLPRRKWVLPSCGFSSP